MEQKSCTGRKAVKNRQQQRYLPSINRPFTQTYRAICDIYTPKSASLCDLALFFPQKNKQQKKHQNILNFNLQFQSKTQV